MIKAAVIGVGYLGRFHAQKYSNNPSVELVGVCDHNPENAKLVAGELQTKAFEKPQDLIGQVDAVTIAASTQAHYELGRLFLEAGIPVNLEKPLAATLPQARELVDLAAKKQTLLCTGHIERFNPSLIELKKTLKKPVAFDLIRHTAFRARGADVSVLHDLMIHDLDLVLWLTGGKVTSLTASGSKVLQPTWDAAEVSLELSTGALARISVSRVSNRPARMVRVLEKGTSITVDSGALTMEIVTPSGGTAEPLATETLQVAKRDALQDETDAFVNAVMGKASPVVTGEDGLIALELVTKIDEAIQGRSV
ncbi:MAG: Gfo/Idh/MocA family oxidoreductase [Bdellovibrionaceae bacterium]|nr:Gfo/Idh/MocA family oxidoreductase [Pseudobdellovibrionaceae bacterium]